MKLRVACGVSATPNGRRIPSSPVARYFGLLLNVYSGFDPTGTFTGTDTHVFVWPRRVVTSFFTSIYRVIVEYWPVLFSLAVSLALASSGFAILLEINSLRMAEGVGFEPTVELPLLLISSQMPLTTQPPFQRAIFSHGCVFIASSFTPSTRTQPHCLTSFLREQAPLPILRRAERFGASGRNRKFVHRHHRRARAQSQEPVP